MANINSEILSLDSDKKKLEASVIHKIKRIFANMADDALALYVTTGNIPAVELSANYQIEFIKEIRDAMRKSIKHFGFEMRDVLEKKHGIFFDVEYKKQIFDIQLKKLSKIDDPELDVKLNAINNEFMGMVTVFVANQSENQAQLIADTNAKEIAAVISASEAQYQEQIESQLARIANLENQPLTPVLSRQIETAKTQLNASIANANEIVGKNIKINLLDKSVARSDLIASQIVGISEAWARQTEANLIHDAKLVNAVGKIGKVNKTWVSILDTLTRSSHASADQQQVQVNEYYSVNGESLMYPRDPNGTASNIVNCRCTSMNEIVFN